METKETYDVRGTQKNLVRQFRFNKESFIHMLFYRILVITSLVTFIVFLLSLVYPASNILVRALGFLILLIWVLVTPQLFEAVKGVVMILSKGTVFGRLNKAYFDLMKKSPAKEAVYRTIPYLVLVLWAGGFAALVYMWSV
ncbi:hypothetical protein M1293_02280 [Candidatus Parvarchaeota archaeon]|nr:hypothetical protein [Candidatus Parvarchaeota archaeon]